MKSGEGLPQLSATKKGCDPDSQSIDGPLDEELSDEETDEWDDDNQGSKQLTLATRMTNDLRVNETRVYDSGDICSRV